MSVYRGIAIRELTVRDVDGFIELKKAGLSSDPDSFLADAEDDDGGYRREVEERLARASVRTGDVILGAFDEDLIGIVAVTRSRNRKRKHKADLHGMYIRPEYRGMGLGRELLERILRLSGMMEGLEEIELIVASHKESVVRLYEKAGFIKTYFEPRALKIGDTYVDAFHMRKEVGSAGTFDHSPVLPHAQPLPPE